MKRALIISAHADDHMMCAGTVFKLKDKGYVPFEIVLTDSSLGQDNGVEKEVHSDEVKEIRKKELSVASKFLGVKKTYQLQQGDLDLVYSRELMFAVVKIVREVKPEVVFLMTPRDMHPDHQAAYKIGLNALKIAATGVLKETLGKPHRVKLILLSEGMIPDRTQISVDITKYMKKKMELFGLYKTQANVDILNYEESLGYIRGYQLRQGGQFAENFTLQEEFPVILFDD